MEQSRAAKNSLKAYVIGFGLSLALTLASFWLVSSHVNSGHTAFPHQNLIFAVSIFAIAQLVAQLVFFLHLGQEPQPRWNLAAFLFMLLVLVIIVAGSLWIMYHLNYNMTPHDSTNYIMNEEGIHK